MLDTRQNSEGISIRRRRECCKCGYRFTSYEKIEDIPLKVVKRDSTRELFDINKITSGVMRATEKRPIPAETMEKLLHKIEDSLLYEGRRSREIRSERIGEMVLEKLSTLDEVAYIRFASVYKKFESANQFVKEIENLI